MKRTWIILFCALIVIIAAIIVFIFPGYYFEIRKAASTTGPPPASTTVWPSFSTSGPPPWSPSGSTSFSPSGTGGTPSGSGTSGSVSPSGSASGSASPSDSGVNPSSPGPTESGETPLEEWLYGTEARKETIDMIRNDVIVPLLGVSAASVAAGLLLTPFLSLLFNFPFRDIFYFFFSSLFEFLGLIRRRRPWGIVYDSVIKQPIQGAVVKIIEADSGKIRETRISDSTGRFGFIVPNGVYQIVAIKNGYTFPSRKTVVDDNGSDGYFNHVYLGGTVAHKEGFLGINVPLDLVVEKKVSKGYLWLLRFARFFERIRVPLLIFGSILALLNLFIFRSVTDFVVLGLYVLLWVVEIITLQNAKPWGEVRDKKGKVLGLSVLRFFKVNNSRLVSTCITDSKGRFFVLLSEGNYYFTVMRSGYKPFRSKPFEIARIKNPPRIDVKLEAQT